MSGIDNYFKKSQFEDDIKTLFYAIMYRQWDVTCEVIQKGIDEKGWQWEEIKDFQFQEDSPDLTIEQCFKYNLDFLKSQKNRLIYQNICEKLKGFEKLNNRNEANTYDDIRFDKKNRRSVIDVFWNGNQPVLNLEYYEEQTMAARQVMKNAASIVLDEVGTGKTVAGIFTMQQVIQERINERKDHKQAEQAAILVICPYNKREDWCSDILRQLGRGSVIIDQSDNGGILTQKSCRQGIPHIYISGNKGGEGDDTKRQLKESFWQYHGEPWDLVIIDECHECFKNYGEIKSKRVLLLTATPIVVKSGECRDFDDYKSLMKKIIDLGGLSKAGITSIEEKYITPIERKNVSEDDIYVCNFKEDIFKNIEIERQITFVLCKRDKRRQQWFDRIRYGTGKGTGFFSAIYSDQDDRLLADKMEKIFRDGDYHITENKKLEELTNIVLGKGAHGKDYGNDSFLIYCERQDAVDFIYDKISGYADKKLMVGKLYGGVAEIKNMQANKDIIMPMLRDNIRNGNRSVLITTGKSGGTGLNLGEFDAVIHYELPFSSNLLEQRFGRIERADDLIEKKRCDGKRALIKNKMIFMVNEAVDGQFDFDTNRMLYYAINKINVTMQYMPVRNTVLFHPDYMNRVKEQAKDVFAKMQKALGREDIKTKINDYFAYKKECDEIRKKIDKLKDKEKFDGKSIKDSVSIWLNDTGKQEGGEIIKDFQGKYIDSGKLEELEDFDKKAMLYIEYYLWLWNTLSFWGTERKNAHFEGIYKQYAEAIEEKTEEEDQTEKEQTEDYLAEDSKECEMSFKNFLEELKKIESGDERNNLIGKMVADILERLEEVDIKHNYSGVFYKKKDGKIVNEKLMKERQGGLAHGQYSTKGH